MSQAEDIPGKDQSDLDIRSWNLMPDIGEANALASDDLICFAEIRDVLVRHGKIDKFGLTLLHKHFLLSDDEVMVEFADETNRCLTTKPIRLDAIGGSIEKSYQTQWWLATGETVGYCNAICYAAENVYLPHKRVHEQR